MFIEHSPFSHNLRCVVQSPLGSFEVDRDTRDTTDKRLLLRTCAFGVCHAIDPVDLLEFAGMSERARRGSVREVEKRDDDVITGLISISINSYLPPTTSTLKCALNSMDLHAERSSYLLSLVVHI